MVKGALAMAKDCEFWSVIDIRKCSVLQGWKKRRNGMSVVGADVLCFQLLFWSSFMSCETLLSVQVFY